LFDLVTSSSSSSSFNLKKKRVMVIVTSYKWGQAYVSFYLSLSGRRKVPLPYAASGTTLGGRRDKRGEGERSH
jgi:hypothetical protein